MNAYQRLLSNTALFAVSTFGSKVLVFLLMPFYTRILSQEDYGVTDLLIQTGNLLIPLVSVGISNAVIRFGLERNSDKKCVFTVGLLTTAAGFALLLSVSPLLERLSFLSGYGKLVLLYVLMANLHTLCSQFARAIGYVRLFALDGVLRTVLTIGFNLWLLAVLQCGVAGYVLANVLADGLSAVFLLAAARLGRYVSLSALRWSTAWEMLRYCVPLVPTTVCTWIINISDRYLIAWMVGDGANGLYAVANKIPTILLIVASIFTSAWQLSALDSRSKREREGFFSNVFAVYQAMAFVVGSGLIMTARISTRLLAGPDFFEAWRNIPILVMATAFACLASFLSSVYMVEKRSMATLATTLLGAGLNIAGNLWLIPRLGAMGAALSTLGSYATLFSVRAIHTRTMLRLRWSLFRLAVNLALMGAQCMLMEWDIPYWPVWSALCFLAVLSLNYRMLLRAVRKAF